MTEFRNDFTKFLDEYRIDSIMQMESPYKEMMSSYLWYNDIISKNWENGIKHIAFRLPGATRGHITVDKDYFIRDIVFYADTCFNKNHNGVECYKQEVVVDTTKKYRDTKLDLVNYLLGDEYLNDET